MPCDGASQKQKKWSYEMGQEVILQNKDEKDLGVVVQDTLIPEWHISQLFGSTYILTNIRVAFHYMDKDMMRKILTSMICLSVSVIY